MRKDIWLVRSSDRNGNMYASQCKSLRLHFVGAPSLAARFWNYDYARELAEIYSSTYSSTWKVVARVAAPSRAAT